MQTRALCRLAATVLVLAVASVALAGVYDQAVLADKPIRCYCTA